MDIAPSGNRVFIALRGPNPLTGNAPGVNNAVGSTPGVGVVRVEQHGRRGALQAIPITHVVSGVELADPHGLRVRVIGAGQPAAPAGPVASRLDSRASLVDAALRPPRLVTGFAAQWVARPSPPSAATATTRTAGTRPRAAAEADHTAYPSAPEQRYVGVDTWLGGMTRPVNLDASSLDDILLGVRIPDSFFQLRK